MRHRTLPLALLIAASLAPVAGCSDGDSDSNTGQPNDLAAEQTDSGSSDASPLPVNDPDSAHGDPDQSAQAASDDPPDQPAPQLAQLQQQVQAMTQAADKRGQRLDDQAQRIDSLEDTVSDLKTRLRRLPQPTQKSNKPAKPAKTPDAVSPQNDGQARESQTRKQGDNSSGNGDRTSDDESSSGPTDAPSPPADAIEACASQRDRGHQFDVFFQGGSDDALNRAIDTINQSAIDDWFAQRGAQRVYLGRYNRCAIAARRRDTVHQTTDLTLYIAAVQARHHSAAHPSRPAESADYGASDNNASTDTQATPRSAVAAPFNLVSVEMRGTHRFLGVAADGAARLHAITWLSPGDRYAGWQLQAIQTDRDRAIFTQGAHTIAVALPDRG